MANDGPAILVVEDEHPIAELISYSLRGNGWDVRVAGSTADGWKALQESVPNLVLLDWMLPDQSGLRFLNRLRNDAQFRSLPVIMLTARSMEEDKVAGLDSGADDYITKPFSPRELVSRVRAQLRRRAPEHDEKQVVAGIVTLEPASHSVHVSGERVEMTNAEYKLLRYFITHPNRVFSRSDLLDRVWGSDVNVELRTVDVHVLRLRKALGVAEAYVRTVRGVGYLFSHE
ncbi:response regulator [Lacisediminimonas profundi]|uniref:response regulator n=1 Tax=Lacisediminimonas profundi TaxID=2603856 RepID=UPI00124B4B5E|nr:response regulator [Lacisediminimonas profundi]